MAQQSESPSPVEKASDRKVAKVELSIDAIFNDKLFETVPVTGHWQKDSMGFERIKKDPETGFTSIVSISLQSPDVEVEVIPTSLLKVNPDDKPLVIESYQWSEQRDKILLYTNTKRVWRLNTKGDYWVLDIKSNRLFKLGGNSAPSTLMFAKFSPDAKSVAFVENQNIYIQSIEDNQAGVIKQLTHTGSPTKVNGTFDWVYEEEFSLHDGFQLSPDGKRIAFWEIDSEGIELFPLVDNTSTLYPKIQYIPYPKVGTTNPAARIGVIELATNDIQWMQIDGDARENYLPRMEWVDSDRLAIQQINRLQNHLQMYVSDVKTGKSVKIFEDKDDAWIDLHEKLFWLKDKSTFLWLSERSGWRHIYAVSANDQSIRSVTKGEFDVIDILGIDERKNIVYFYASPDNASQKYLFQVPIDGGPVKRVTPESDSGTNQYVLSPDNQRAVVTSSRFASPPVTKVIKLNDYSVDFIVESNEALTRNLEQIRLPRHEFFQVDIGSNVQLDAWCIYPIDFDPSKRYPVIVHVYGEPAGQTVLDRWGGERLMWHQMLADQGYFVVSFDNRGTPSPKGREWRKCIYRKVGTLASDDQAAAIQSLLHSRKYLDPRRVGIWGWSGGGSMTLNAVFRFPKLYQSGVSIAPVPNQLYYDTIYQERYMGLPNDNESGYRDGSPINFVKNLEAQLLVVHGTGDDNCHYQTTELLVDELIKHNKQFSMFAYPNRSHAIREGENTSRHLYQMITDHFKKTVAPVAR